MVVPGGKQWGSREATSLQCPVRSTSWRGDPGFSSDWINQKNAWILPSPHAQGELVLSLGTHQPLPPLLQVPAARAVLEGTLQVRGRGAGGAWRAEQLRCREDLRFRQLSRLHPQAPATSTGQTPGPTPQAASMTTSKVAQTHCPSGSSQQPFPVRCPGSSIRPPSPFHLLIGVMDVEVTATATPGAGVSRAGQGLGGLWEACLPCALQKGEPASYLFPTPVAAALPGPTAFPLLPPQTAGSASPTGATPRLGGAHPSYLTAEAGASECSYWGRREREAGTGEKPAPLIGQRRCHSQLQGFCGLPASEPLKSEVPKPSASWSENTGGGNLFWGPDIKGSKREGGNLTKSDSGNS